MSHGQAAKLINVFVKALMPSNIYSVSSEIKEYWCRIVHPPIDSILLKNMQDENFGNLNIRWNTKYTWTKLNPNEYEFIIKAIKDNEPCLWKIERLWKFDSYEDRGGSA